MKLVTFLFSVIIFDTTCVVGQSLSNLDMELTDYSTMLPKGWTTSGDKNLFSFAMDSTVKQHGKYSLFLQGKNDNSDDEESFVSYSWKAVQSGQKITAHGFIKTENNNGGFIFFKTKRNNSAENIFDGVNLVDKGFKRTNDWQHFTIETEYDEIDADSLMFGISPGTGKIWLDNVTIQIDGKSISKAPLKIFKNYPARSDTAFRHSSGIAIPSLTEQQIENLSNLGILWGFLKYYHPAVTKGTYNWDAELFRVLPKVLTAENKTAANKAMEEWVDKLGKPAKCIQCIVIKKDSSVKLMPDYANLFKQGNFPSSLINKLQYILKNRSADNKYYIHLDYYGYPYFKNEETYADMLYPDTGYRLLALYRYWNTIQYFYPHRNLIDVDWDKVLREFISKFINANDALTYHLAIAEISTRIYDSHTDVQTRLMGDYYGRFSSPVQVKFVEDQLVVSGYYVSDTITINQFKLGDIITKVDGKTIPELIKTFSVNTGASNYSKLLSKIQTRVLRGTNARAVVEIVRDGKTITVQMQRIARGNAINLAKDKDPSPKDSSYKLINNSIGYFNPGKYKDSQFDKIKETFKNAKGMIIDFRTYPSGCTSCLFNSWIHMSDVHQLSTKANVYTPGLFTFKPKIKKELLEKDYYKGKIVVIVNDITVSAAEGQATSLRTAPNTIVTGTTTAGANGTNVIITLPGNVMTSFTGIGVYRSDGLWAQRTGLKIDVPIKPTIKGIKESRDELLEKAIEIIENQK